MRGRGLCILKISGLCDIHLLVNLKRNRAALLLLARDRFLSLTAFAYCPVADCGWPNADFCNFGWIPICEALLWVSSKLGWDRNIRAVKSDH